MPRQQNDVAVRLAASGDEDVKRRLQALGKDGQAALQRLERGGVGASRGLLAIDRASRDLQGLASGYASRIGPLGAALVALGPAGLAAAAGIGAVTLGLNVALDRSRQALQVADTIATTADLVGLGVESLQEFRFAALEAADVQSRVFDIAMQRFARRVGEAAQGSGELTDTLKQYGIEVRDAEGRQRALVDVYDDYADAVAGVGSEQEQLRLAFKAFDSEGAVMVNLLRRGGDGNRALRAEAHALGLVWREELVRDGQKVNRELKIQQQIIDLQLNSALVRLGPVLTDVGDLWVTLATGIGRASDAWSLWQGKVDEVSLQGLEEEAGDLREEIDALGRSLHDLNANRVTAFVNRDRIEGLLAERERLLAELREIQGEIDRRNKARAAAAGGDGGTGIATPAQRDALQKYLDQLREEGRLLEFTGRAREIQQALGKAEALALQEQVELTPKLRAEIEQLTGARYDLERALKLQAEANALASAAAEAERSAREAALERGRAIVKAREDVVLQMQREAEHAKALLALAGEDERTRRIEIELLEARNRLRATGQVLLKEEEPEIRAIVAAQVDAERALDRHRQALEFVGDSGERAFDRIGSSITEMALAGKSDLVELGNVGRAVASELAQAAIQLFLLNKLKNELLGTDLPTGGGLLETVIQGVLGFFAGGGAGGANVGDLGGVRGPGGVNVAHGGGVLGRDRFPQRSVDAGIFDRAPRLHGGGVAGDEMPIIARRGEGIFTEEQMAAMGRPVINIRIVNNTGAQVTTRERRTPGGGMDLELQFDEMVAGSLRREPGRTAVLDLVQGGGTFRPFAR